MLALCSKLLRTYYAHFNAGIISSPLVRGGGGGGGGVDELSQNLQLGAQLVQAVALAAVCKGCSKAGLWNELVLQHT